MTLSSRLSRLQSSILDKLSIAAHDRDIPAISRWSRAAEECALIEKEVLALEKKVEAFEVSLSDGMGLVQPVDQELIVTSNPSLHKRETSTARIEGKVVRNEWIKALSSAHGIALLGRGKVYQTSKQAAVGIAFANELPDIPNKWFLGLPDRLIDIAVILCQTSEKKLYDIVIPVADLGAAWGMLGRSNRQIKIHIKKDSDDFLLLVPRSDSIRVTQYVSQYDPLR